MYPDFERDVNEAVNVLKRMSHRSKEERLAIIRDWFRKRNKEEAIKEAFKRLGESV